ncbi:hypothetical protein [Reichenbachiella sp. MALMAid0571]|uniref:hypothetical protein n=1 Tax=Reichenbachiella sp. MALMAid0571 TaxID=3143939 RepID=UPI0032DFB7AE
MSNRLLKYAVCLLPLLISCNRSTNVVVYPSKVSTSVVSSTWMSESSYNSSVIRAESSLSGTELTTEIRSILSRLSFEIQSDKDDTIITKPYKIDGREMRLNIRYQGNIVLVSGDQGSNSYGGGVNWKPIIRDTHPWGSPWWERMNVFAKVIGDLSLGYK